MSTEKMFRKQYCSNRRRNIANEKKAVEKINIFFLLLIFLTIYYIIFSIISIQYYMVEPVEVW